MSITTRGEGTTRRSDLLGPVGAEPQVEERTREELERLVEERTHALQASEERFRAQSAELVQAEERERRRLAQLLHDHIQQILVAAKLGAGALVRREPDEALRATARQVHDLIGQAIEASRTLTAELAPPTLHEGGLAAGLVWLARWMKRTHGLEVELGGEAARRAEQDKTSPGIVIDAPEVLRVFLFQAARELLFNVVKHSGACLARLSLARESEGCLRLTVADDGAGFDPAAKRDSGSVGGFGLYHLRERVSSFGGRFDIASRPGQGTRVTIVVPLPPSTPPPAEPGAPSRREGRPSETPSVELPLEEPIRVVIVDDHAILRQGLVELLHKEPGFEVVGEAADGIEAIDAARRLRPDVVVMDVGLPRMDGVEATRALTAEMPTIRVIGLSMYEGGTTEAAMLEAQAYAFLPKDGPAENLVAAIRRAGSRSKRGR